MHFNSWNEIAYETMNDLIKHTKNDMACKRFCVCSGRNNCGVVDATTNCLMVSILGNHKCPLWQFVPRPINNKLLQRCVLQRPSHWCPWWNQTRWLQAWWRCQCQRQQKSPDTFLHSNRSGSLKSTWYPWGFPPSLMIVDTGCLFWLARILSIWAQQSGLPCFELFGSALACASITSRRTCSWWDCINFGLTPIRSATCLFTSLRLRLLAFT